MVLFKKVIYFVTPANVSGTEKVGTEGIKNKSNYRFYELKQIWIIGFMNDIHQNSPSTNYLIFGCLPGNELYTVLQIHTTIFK